MNNTQSDIQDLETEAIEKLADILKKTRGKLSILVKDSPAISISLDSNNIQLDIHDPYIFDDLAIEKTDAGLFDKLRTARKFGEKLNSNALSLSVLRKGKKEFTLGSDFTPTFSSIFTGSDDIHIDSVT